MSTTEDQDPEFEALLQHLKESRGFDFTGYKRASLTRRVRKRMQEVDVASYPDYMALLEESPAEFVDLFNTILINVTAFLRDKAAWDHLAANVIPRIVDSRADDEPIRVWSAGCASGEEAYSLAVLLCEALGDERFRNTVKIYGSDVDDDAIAQARQARYPLKALQSAFTEDQVDRYFEHGDAGYVFRKDLRRSVIYGRHDLVQDPPISRIDLLVCRNTLMYFNADIQRRILSNFHFALNEGAFLFLGKSEALVTRTNLFAVDDIKHHVFQKRSGTHTNRVALPAPRPLGRLEPHDAGPDHLLQAGFENAALAQLLVDARGHLVHANRHARALFGLSTRQMGRPLKDLELSYRPLDLRSRIDQTLREHRPQTVADVDWPGPDGSDETYEVLFQPVGSEATSLGVSITFTATGQYQMLRDELERSQRELEVAYEELQSTVEELETTNEELQSTNEELETTNEELHSTNEELETMNEELQSTNEELETINGELRHSTDDLDRANAFLAAILGSLGSAVVVLDPQFAVRIWNRDAEELWGLRADEVEGQHFLNLDIGLPVETLRGPIRASLGGAVRDEVVVDAVNRRGRSVRCTVVVAPLVDVDGTDGVILRMEAEPAADEGAGATP